MRRDSVYNSIYQVTKALKQYIFSVISENHSSNVPTDEETDGWVGGWVGGWMDGWTGWIQYTPIHLCWSECIMKLHSNILILLFKKTHHAKLYVTLGFTFIIFKFTQEVLLPDFHTEVTQEVLLPDFHTEVTQEVLLPDFHAEVWEYQQADNSECTYEIWIILEISKYIFISILLNSHVDKALLNWNHLFFH